MIDKPSIIVTSLGRTGTKFFANFFDHIIPESTSLHEPDIFNFSFKKGKGLKNLTIQIKESDFKNLIVKKALGKWSLVKLSDKRFCKNINREVTIYNILNQRKQFILTRYGKYYIGSNVGYYGLIDILPNVFQTHKAVYIIRDGNDWIVSNMKWGEMYGKNRIRKLFAHNWPEAKDISNDEYFKKWTKLSRFEKLCWAWSRLNEYALSSIKNNSNAMYIRFEDIFYSNDGYNVLNKVVDFVTDMPNGEKIQFAGIHGWLDKKIHKSIGYYPDKFSWDKEQKRFFNKVCGPLMEEIGYHMS